MAAVLYVVLAWLSWGQPPDVRRAWEAPAADPRLLVAMLLIFVELDAGHRVSRSSSRPSPARSWRPSSPSHCSSPAISAPTCRRRSSRRRVASRRRQLASGLYHVLPDFALFDVKAAVVHGGRFRPAASRMAVGYAALVHRRPAAAVPMLIFSQARLQVSGIPRLHVAALRGGRGLSRRRHRTSRGRAAPWLCPTGRAEAASCTSDRARR